MFFSISHVQRVERLRAVGTDWNFGEPSCKHRGKGRKVAGASVSARLQRSSCVEARAGHREDDGEGEKERIDARCG